MEERVQKILSALGYGSRRRAEEWIVAGRVTVNGRVISLGARADPDQDAIAFDGVPLTEGAPRTYLMLYKPRGYVTTLKDEWGRPTVGELVQGCGKRVWPVGRLDQDSEGLLLMTDDGAWTHHLLHPSHRVEKEYRVWVTGDVAQALPKLRGELVLDGVVLAPAQVEQVRREEGSTQLSVTIHQGKKRQIRRMCALAGLTVHRLKRIREGEVRLDHRLRAGQWRGLTPKEVTALAGSIQERRPGHRPP